MIMKKIYLAAVLIWAFAPNIYSQIGKCKGKYFGNIIAGTVHSNYSSLWNQVTAENGSKWGSCDRGNGVYDFGQSDISYNWAKNNGGLFKFHALIWGAQAPGYLKDADAATVTAAIRRWYQAVQDHYDPKGGLDMIDVLNEPVNTGIDVELNNLKAALTLGYRQETANQNDLDNPYGWAIWTFQLARKHFPNSLLLINEFNIEHNWNNCRAEYIRMSNAIKAAPNLTDGQKNLIDGIGLQAHGIETLSAERYKACLDEMWEKTGLPLHISEIDIAADPNEELQRSQFAHFIKISWEHPAVAGITLWGYIQGHTWRRGNNVTGAGGTDTGIQYGNLTDRPAMTWIKEYFASLPDLPCCPAPWPFANCDKGAVPKVAITAPTGGAFQVNAPITIEAGATDSDGTITHVFFYANNVLIQEEWVAPYSFEWTPSLPGQYTIRAVVTDNDGNTAQNSIIIRVNPLQAPYGGVPHILPGKIEFEHFDIGGNGFAYFDNTAGSQVSPRPDFRTDEDVDIEVCTDTGGGYNLGWTDAGEWLEYTVNVAKTAEYDIVIRAAVAGGGRTISLSSNGKPIAANIAIPNTTGWQVWTDVVVPNVKLEAGQQVIRLTIGSVNHVNLNYMTFSASKLPAMQLKAGWNLIAFPLDGSENVDKALSGIWEYVEAVKDTDEFYDKKVPDALNTLKKLAYGKGYMLKVSQNCVLQW
jgi:GH35 family endo-1,4-beta-xylanase